MQKKAWFHYYLLVMGSTILTLGIILLFRNYRAHGSMSGFFLGGTLVLYGFLRLRQRKTYRLER